MKNNKELLPHPKEIEILIFTFRGEKVMLDRDLAMLYGVKTKTMNQAVKRNKERFEGYFFELSDQESRELVTNCDRFSSLKHSTNNPHAFNEYGILMLSSVLKSKIAIDINRKIIKTFVELRKQTIENSAYELMQQKIKTVQSQIEEIRTHALVSEATLASKSAHLNKELITLREDVFNINETLDTLKNNHIIIKRPEEGLNKG